MQAAGWLAVAGMEAQVEVMAPEAQVEVMAPAMGGAVMEWRQQLAPRLSLLDERHSSTEG